MWQDPFEKKNLRTILNHSCPDPVLLSEDCPDWGVGGEVSGDKSGLCCPEPYAKVHVFMQSTDLVNESVFQVGLSHSEKI